MARIFHPRKLRRAQRMHLFHSARICLLWGRSGTRDYPRGRTASKTARDSPSKEHNQNKHQQQFTRMLTYNYTLRRTHCRVLQGGIQVGARYPT
eukprot:5804825-Pyramimonas_sp.AAC.1